nr:hypothetical protein [Massilia sp. JS1662]
MMFKQAMMDHVKLFLALVVALLLGCSQGVPIAITNQSGRALQNVTVSGAGFSQHLASIPAGKTATLRVHPRGETGVAIGFELGGKKFSYAESGYFEASGYKVAIAVDHAGRASVNAELTNY